MKTFLRPFMTKLSLGFALGCAFVFVLVYSTSLWFSLVSELLIILVLFPLVSKYGISE
jgi:hypothetical protein